MSIYVETSPGELLDKISILEIKMERMHDEEKLRNVRIELDALKEAGRGEIVSSPELNDLFDRLKSVNEELWDIEDEIRVCERKMDFGKTFVRLSRGVYHSNDRRSGLKRRINELLGTRIMEEKSYAPY